MQVILTTLHFFGKAFENTHHTKNHMIMKPMVHEHLKNRMKTVNKSIKLLALLLLCTPFISCAQIKIGKKTYTVPNVNTSGNNSGKPSNDEMVNGLKEALNIGVSKGADNVSKTDGYFKNMAIKILMPPEVKNVEDKLRSVGMGQLVDDAVLRMNRAAEQAGPKAKPIFVDAIKSMSIMDAVNIIKGPQDGATQYLKKSTSAQLTAAFKPIISQELDKTEATKYWKQVFDTYNKIPFVTKVNSDLPSYVTQKALDGLFYMVAQEEVNIRHDPMAYASSLIQKIFSGKW